MTRWGAGARSLWEAFRHPVHPETAGHLRALWRELPRELQGPGQMFGRQTEGCAATIGVEPRCDFACTGCYLGEGANSVPPLAFRAVREQLDHIRGDVGRFGNVQITDGEVTLRPARELVRILAYARSIELEPMVMTHGDGFRRRPGLLERLVVEGGLREVCFHVDTTQRGRRGVARADGEADLDFVRAELAALVRRVRASTGQPLRAASTITVTRENLADVPGIVRWFVRNADVFRVASFQPAAAVGRTRAGVGGGVDVEALWDGIADGAGLPRDRADRGRVTFGHPACTRGLLGLVVERPGSAPTYHPWRDSASARDERDVLAYLDRFGGVGLRSEGRAVLAARLAGMVAAAPGLALGRAAPYFARLLGRLAADPARLALELARGRARVHGLALVSHHFMGADELATPAGKERLAACTFRVPVGGRMVSMCEVNAAGHRERLYAGARSERARRPQETPTP